MRFFVEFNAEKHYLPYRDKQIRRKFDFLYYLDETFQIKGIDHVFTVWDIKAEGSESSIEAGVLIGGLIGFLGGPIGVLIGAFVGGFIQWVELDKENRQVEIFNSK